MLHHFLGWQSWVASILNNSRLVENYSSHLLHQHLAFHLHIEMKCRYLACWFYLIYFFNFSTDILENWCGRITAQIFHSYLRNFIQFWVVIKLYFFRQFLTLIQRWGPGWREQSLRTQRNKNFSPQPPHPGLTSHPSQASNSRWTSAISNNFVNTPDCYNV